MISAPPPPEVVYAISAPECSSHSYGLTIGVPWEGIFVAETSEMPTLPQEMIEYLNDRAKEVGISFADAYSEEMAARD